MKADKKHYKFINSQTGNTIFHHTLNADLGEEDIKTEMEKLRVQVAKQTGLFVDIIYWEEAKEEK